MKKVTKILSFVLSICLMLSAFTFTAFAEDFSGTCGANLVWALDNGTLTISGDGVMDDFYSPGECPWASQSENIKSIVIKKGVTSIGSWAFPDLSVESVSISNSVTSIGNGAFLHCKSLESITIPNSVTYIGEDAFIYCRSLESISIPNSVTYIGEDAFHGCLALVSVSISDSVTEISHDAFCICPSLESIVVSSGNTVYHSENNCLIETESKTLVAGCKNSVIPSDGSVKYIGDSAFYGCTSLKSITIPDSVTKIYFSAFEECTSLESISIPNSVTEINPFAFNGCSSLKSISISDSVTEIYNHVFLRCPSLESIVVSSGNTVYHSENNCLIETESKTLVLGCKNSVIPSDGSVIYISNSAFDGCSSLESISIPSSITHIENYAFNDCSSLKSVSIPDSVTSIGNYAFGYCYDDTGAYVKVESFTIYGKKGSAAEKYATENGFIFTEAVTLPESDTNEYMDEETLTMPNVVERTTVKNLISALSNYGITATITDKDGNTLADTAKIGTGSKVTTTDGKAYTVIVKGDVNGTGEIDSTDYLQIKADLLEKNDLSDEYFTAADVDNDNIITSTDYLKIKAHFLGTWGLYK